MTIGVKEWKGMFQDIGLTEDVMMKWHRIFEERYPQEHQLFLEHLGVDEKTIKTIRTN